MDIDGQLAGWMNTKPPSDLTDLPLCKFPASLFPQCNVCFANKEEGTEYNGSLQCMHSEI